MVSSKTNEKQVVQRGGGGVIRREGGKMGRKVKKLSHHCSEPSLGNTMFFIYKTGRSMLSVHRFPV